MDRIERNLYQNHYYKIKPEKIKEKILKASEKYGYNRYKFHYKAQNYVRYHHLKPKVCSICKLEKEIQIHHPSYKEFNQRENVVFVCKDCHKLIHDGKINCPDPINLKILKKGFTFVKG